MQSVEMLEARDESFGRGNLKLANEPPASYRFTSISHVSCTIVTCSYDQKQRRRAADLAFWALIGERHI